MGVISLALALLSMVPLHGQEKDPVQITRGTLDLAPWDLSKDGPVKIEGDVEFYWKKLYRTDDFRKKNPPKPDTYIKIPGPWGKGKIKGENIPPDGFGTYRFVIKNVQSSKTLGFKLLSIGTAYRLFVNGKEIASEGRVGKSKSEGHPSVFPKVADFIPEGSDIEVIFHVSNYHYYHAGVFDPIHFGLASDLYNKRMRNIIFSLFILGSIFIMALYHLGLFLLRRKYRAPLWFALFCLFLFMRSIVQNERILPYLLGSMPFEIIFKIEFAGWYMGLAMYATFLYSLFREEFSKRFLIIILALLFTGSLVTAILPARIHSNILPAYMGITLIFSLYALYVIILAIFRRRLSAVTIFLGSMALFATTMNDILASLKVIDSIYVMPIGLFIFIFAQAYTLAERYSTSFETAEKLKVRVEEDNRILIDILSNIREAATDLTDFSDTLKNTTKELQDDMENQGASLLETSSSSEEVAAAVMSISDNVKNQDRAINENNSILNEYVESLKQITEAARNANSLSSISKDKTEQSRNRLMEIIRGMESIRNSSSAINEITEIINEISEQTNLLSLNASIEAARAGDSGRGFAVVAEEIGKLADRSITQAKSIQEHVRTTIESIENETEIINNSADVIMEIGNAVNDVNTAVETILELCLKQEQLAATIQDNMSSIARESSYITSATDEQKTTMEEVSKSLEHLTTIMDHVVNNTNTLMDSTLILHKQTEAMRKISRGEESKGDA
jgi:methyl-accepting chemotaxis protein